MDKGHGRIETREATICQDIQIPKDLHYRPGLEAGGKVKATHEIKGTQETETRFSLLNSKMGPERFLKTVCTRWAGEYSLYRKLDTAMNEDAQRSRMGNRPEN